MNVITVGVTAAILAAGWAGGVSAYRAAAGPAEVVVPVKRTVEPPPIVKWAPCAANSRLENGVCVHEVVRTVVRPAPADSSQATSNDASWDEVQRQLDADDREVSGEDVSGEEAGDRDDDQDEDEVGDDRGADDSGWGDSDDGERQDDD